MFEERDRALPATRSLSNPAPATTETNRYNRLAMPFIYPVPDSDRREE
ncbi:hypothetical protein ACFLVW_07595 [Chloroflexota bacterium]